MKKKLLFMAALASIISIGLLSSCNDNPYRPCLQAIFHKDSRITNDSRGNILIPLDINNDSVIDLVLTQSLSEGHYFLWKRGVNPDSSFVVYLFQNRHDFEYLSIFDVLYLNQDRPVYYHGESNSTE